MASTATCCSTATTASSSAPATPTSMSGCRCCGCSIGLAVACAVACWANVRLADLAHSSRRAGAAVRQLVRASTVLVPALFQRLYVKPSELQLETPYIERNIALTREAYNLRQIAVKPFPAEEGLSLAVAPGQPRDHRQHPAVGLAAADGHLRAAAGDPDLLQVPRRRCRSLPARRRLSAGDAVGARAGAVAAAVQRADLGQPASALHPRQRRGHVPGHAEVQRRPAGLLPAGHPAGRLRRSRHPRAAHLFRPGRASATSSSRAARRSSTIPRARTTSTRPTTARTASPSATRPGAACSPGISTTRTSCSAATSPARAGSCSIATSRIACGRSPRSCASTAIPISWSATGGCSGCRTPTPRATGSPTPSRNPPAALNYIRNSVKVVIDAYNGTVDFYVADPARSADRDLPAHLPRPVQAVRGDAAGPAKAHPLPGGPLPHPGAALPRLPHGHARSLL